MFSFNVSVCSKLLYKISRLFYILFYFYEGILNYFFQKLSRPDILENIIMITPGLSQDPVAISMIQDPELLVRLGDIETVRRFLFHTILSLVYGGLNINYLFDLHI